MDYNRWLAVAALSAVLSLFSLVCVFLLGVMGIQHIDATPQTLILVNVTECGEKTDDAGECVYTPVLQSIATELAMFLVLDVPMNVEVRFLPTCLKGMQPGECVAPGSAAQLRGKWIDTTTVCARHQIQYSLFNNSVSLGLGARHNEAYRIPRALWTQLMARKDRKLNRAVQRDNVSDFTIVINLDSAYWWPGMPFDSDKTAYNLKTLFTHELLHGLGIAVGLDRRQVALSKSLNQHVLDNNQDNINAFPDLFEANIYFSKQGADGSRLVAPGSVLRWRDVVRDERGLYKCVKRTAACEFDPEVLVRLGYLQPNELELGPDERMRRAQENLQRKMYVLVTQSRAFFGPARIEQCINQSLPLLVDREFHEGKTLSHTTPEMVETGEFALVMGAGRLTAERTYFERFEKTFRRSGVGLKTACALYSLGYGIASFPKPIDACFANYPDVSLTTDYNATSSPARD